MSHKIKNNSLLILNKKCFSKTNYQTIYENNKKSNGVAEYIFYGVKTNRGLQLITKETYDYLKYRSYNVFSFSHFGIKIRISDKLIMFSLFSSDPNNLTNKLSLKYTDLKGVSHDSTFKGMNRPIFIENETFAKYYTANYHYNNFPKYVKNAYKNTHEDKKRLAEEVYIHLKQQYLLMLGEENQDMSSLIFALESDLTLKYVDFSYKNVLLCSSLGMLRGSLSKLFLHSFNGKFKLEKSYDPSNLTNLKRVELTNKTIIHSNNLPQNDQNIIHNLDDMHKRFLGELEPMDYINSWESTIL